MDFRPEIVISHPLISVIAYRLLFFMILAKNFHLKGRVLCGGVSILGNFLAPDEYPMDFSPEMVISLQTSFKKWSGERLFS